MITRLEVDGFKNLLNFSVDFGPFNCIAGPNGVGKSNVFDAIRFLSLLVEHPLVEAAAQVRGDNVGGDSRDIFWRRDEGVITIAVEMIVPLKITDDFGQVAEPTSTFLRYEVQINYTPLNRGDSGIVGGLTLLHENLHALSKEDSERKLRFLDEQFREKAILHKRRSNGYITTQRLPDNRNEIIVHEGQGRGGLHLRAEKTPRTVLSSANSAKSPTILAAKRELQSWRLLTLEPDAIRQPGSLQLALSGSIVSNNGENLPAILYRLKYFPKQASTFDPILWIVSWLRNLIPVEEIDLDVNENRNEVSLLVKERRNVMLPARSLSDGTLRFLALIVLLQSTSYGLICLEEPENGLHPKKLRSLVDLLQVMTFDSTYPVDEEDNPLRQIIIATHSPVIIQLIEPQSLLVATDALLRYRNDQPASALRLYPLVGTWRDTERKGVSVLWLLDYLTAPKDAHLTAPKFSEA